MKYKYTSLESMIADKDIPKETKNLALKEYGAGYGAKVDNAQAYNTMGLYYHCIRRGVDRMNNYLNDLK